MVNPKQSDDWKLSDEARKALNLALWELREDKERINDKFRETWPDYDGKDETASEVETYLEDLDALEQALEDLAFEVFDEQGKPNVAAPA